MKLNLRKSKLGILLGLLLIFLLAATPAQAFRFAFMSDSRHCGYVPKYNTNVLSKILQKIEEISDAEPDNPIDFIIFGGDMACQGGKSNLSSWEKFVKDNLPPKKDGTSKIPLYVAKGNHELYGPDKTYTERKVHNKDYQEVFPPIVKANPCQLKGGYSEHAAYSFEHGAKNTCLFVVLDTYENLQDTDVRAYLSVEQSNWLEGELVKKEALEHPGKSFVHKFVIGHCPVAPKDNGGKHGWKDYPDYPGVNTDLAGRLKDKGVRAYFCGHDHLYDRQDNLLGYGFDQIIVGNAGATPPTPYPWNFMVVDVIDSNQVKYTIYKSMKDGGWDDQESTTSWFDNPRYQP